MRLAAYAGASTVLAASVVLRAFHARPNFYSASVYLAQSSACRMILLNLLLLMAYGLMRGLQRLLYGPLRAIEREQLWDKAWYAVTETALAMTTFRDEVGAWFFIMFVSLLAGKVWGWISEARVEALEQQPPTNPRLFHLRLTTSLILSEVFDFLMLRYCVYTLLEQPRPGMMVMFAFEFAVLTISSSSTAVKYALSLYESLVIRRQTKARIEERREEIRAARDEARSQATAEAGQGTNIETATTDADAEEGIDEGEIDVPGWQEKGRWLLFFDLLTDLLKLLVYLCFFSVLLMFHGIPIHIIRDVFLTTRSFVKRITDFMKYRSATKDMNARYPDATAEELERDGTCIICREEMTAWVEPQPQAAAAGANRRPTRAVIDERQRPKKLPCGHVLHFGCLRSWLERQQVCPTCRSSVLATPTNNNTAGTGNQANRGPNGAQPQGDAANPRNPDQPPVRPGARRARTFNLGPWRFAFAAGNEQQVREALQRMREENEANGAQMRAVGGVQFGGPEGENGNNTTLPRLNAHDAHHSGATGGSRARSRERQLARIEEQIMREVNSLNLTLEQLTLTRTLHQELTRLRLTRASESGDTASVQVPSTQIGPGVTQNQALGIQPQVRILPFNQPFGQQYQLPGMLAPPQFHQQVLRPLPRQQALDSGHADLPTGLNLPPGWTLMPLQRERPHVQDSTSVDSTSTISQDRVLPQISLSAAQPLRPAASQTTTPRLNQPIPSTSVPRANGLSSEQATIDAADPLISLDGTPFPQPSPADSAPTNANLNVVPDTQPAIQTTPSIPDWSDWGSTLPTLPVAPPETSQPLELVIDGSGGRNADAEGSIMVEAESSSSGPSLEANGSTGGGKEKAKAATVEDSIDDEEKQ